MRKSEWSKHSLTIDPENNWIKERQAKWLLNKAILRKTHLTRESINP